MAFAPGDAIRKMYRKFHAAALTAYFVTITEDKITIK